MNQPLANQAITILGSRTPSIPIGGTIRAGIKVLTRAAAGNPEIVRLYNAGVAAGISFDDIQKQIRKAAPNITYPLTPKNVDYFTVRAGDFPNPETARQILEMYGEDRGDGLRLYRFPVIFAADAWQSAMPHNLACYAGNERRYWSEYGPNGERQCHSKPPAKEQSNGKRVVRHFGPREIALRQENKGVCDPESCQEYQTRQCNLSGRFIFYIPGIKSISAIQLPTRSFHAMDSAIKIFGAITHMRGGVSGFLDNNRTPFYITKKQRDTNFIDDEGHTVTAPQWIIDLEAPVDVAELLYTAQSAKHLTLQAAASAALLEAPGTIVQATSDAAPAEAINHEAFESTSRLTRQGDVIDGQATDKTIGTPQESPSVVAACAFAPADAEQLGGVLSLLDDLAVESALYLAYADKKYGVGWRRNPKGRQKAEAEIRGYQGNAQGLVETLTEALMGQ